MNSIGLPAGAGAHRKQYQCDSLFTWWEGATPYYIVEQWARYTVSRSRHDKLWLYSAWRLDRCYNGRDAHAAPRWHWLDNGLLGVFGSSREAIECCQEYEFDWQACQINGLFFGPLTIG